MADVRVTDLDEFVDDFVGDEVVHLVDVNDTAETAEGSSRKVKVSNFKKLITEAHGFVVDGGGSVIETGQVKGYFTCPVNADLVGWSISVDTGTCTIKTWKKASGTAVPTISDVISTSGVSISSGTHIESTTMSDFTTTDVTAGDIFAWDITAVSGATQITFELLFKRK